MRKLILGALIAATAMPGAAMAQNGELRRDRQEIREERRDVRDARRYGDRQDVREQRGELRDARREYRQDQRDYGRNDWRAYRNGNRGLFARGDWRSDYRYSAFRPGVRIRPGYYSPRYVIAQPWRYRLARPAYNQRWVRHYNDVLLIDVRRGYVVDVIRNFYF